MLSRQQGCVYTLLNHAFDWFLMKQKEFKEKMPMCAAWIDSLVAAFGAEVIHGQIRRGLEGEPTFHAIENGHEIGTPVYRDGQAGDSNGK